ncbi:C/H/G cyclin [Exidia glandulosa HHB12029]|uniref:C/H/G cyclin n=1 Tax=Exidia glandulosa HHB12029 TaxID=1314781 RepID=A0A165J322_EXIGL|nr:C/H/G cyclin [Exidia glandulosa HHB12029]
MAANFWVSSHYKRWMVDRSTIEQARADDQEYATPNELSLLGILFANIIVKLARRLSLRQRVIATAHVFFRRFYLKNSYCDTDPYMVIAACVYVAAKAEETPVHVKSVVNEARNLYQSGEYHIKNFPSDNARLAEMEFYLVDELECDLTVFHPYRTLLTLDSSTDSSLIHEAEAGELGAGVNDESSPRYWGTGAGKLELPEGCIQLAWFIINDTYRSDTLCLVYPPHMIAIAAIHVAIVLHADTRKQPAPRRSSRRSNPSPRSTDAVAFLAGLNVNMSEIATIMQDMLGLYKLWSMFSDDAPDAKGVGGSPGDSTVTTKSLVDLLTQMRGGRDRDVAHPDSGRPVQQTKLLEMTQTQSSLVSGWRA